MRHVIVAICFVFPVIGYLCYHAGTNTTARVENAAIEDVARTCFHPERFGNGMRAIFRLKGTHEQAFAAASNAFSAAGLRLTELDKVIYVLRGVPDIGHKELSEISDICIQQIGFRPRPDRADLNYVEWHIVLFWKDGILKSRMDPSFRTDPKVTDALERVLRKLFDSITKEMPPMSPDMPRPK